MKNKLIAIVGPTASGKSELAVKIARAIDGEVVSADSRQVYKGMDIGSGKISKKEMMGVPHHLLDVASPRSQFSAGRYQKLARTKINRIQESGKIPILCGGTGLYVQAVVDGIVIPEVKPNWKLRHRLKKLPAQSLFAILKKLDRRRAGNIDVKNPRRLIRAIEIAKTLGKVPKFTKQPLPYPVLFLGIKIPTGRLKQKIRQRLKKRLDAGMINEVKRLRASGLSWRRLENFGLEYRSIALYLQKRIPRREMAERIKKESWQYAKRQLTWFKRDHRIKWVSRKTQAQPLVKKYLTKTKATRN